jgi:hypothetical protein
MTTSRKSFGSGGLVPALCSLPERLVAATRRHLAGRQEVPPFDPPAIRIGKREEYLSWKSKARTYLRELGEDPLALERVDATFNYARNRILLFNLPDPGRELSIAETISHEILHSLLEQTQERWAARALDKVVKPVGDPSRVGGV